MKRIWGIIIVACMAWILGACDPGDQTPPGAVSDLTFFTDPDALDHSGGSFVLHHEKFPAKTYALAWTASGDNGDQGKAALYDLRYITEFEVRKYGPAAEVCERNNHRLHPVFSEPGPRSSGAIEIFSLLDQGLVRGAKYHLCLWVSDEVGQISDPAAIDFKVPFLGIGLSTRKAPIPGLGTKVAELDNFNKSGFTDLGVSSPAQGKVMVYFGKSSDQLALTTYVFDRPLQAVGKLWPGLHIYGDPAESFGFAMAGLRKINNGPRRHLAISGPDASAGAGRVYLFAHTDKESLTTAQASSVIDGEAAGDQLGYALSNCHDLSSDGRTDFAVSAPGTGKVYVVLGGSTTLGPVPKSGTIAAAASFVIIGDPATGFGKSLDCGTDLNDDGAPDLLIGAGQANAGTGAAYVVLGGSTGEVKFDNITTRGLPVVIDLTSGGQADLVINGANPGENFGSSVAMIGDIWNRPRPKSDKKKGNKLVDTSRDFAVGAPGLGNGSVYIFFGGPKGNLLLDRMIFPASVSASQADLILTGEAGQVIGGQIAGNGDLNRDHHDDLVSSNGNGAVIAYYLKPVHNPDKINDQRFKDAHPIDSFLLVRGVFQSGESDLLLGIPGINGAIILK